MIENSPCFECMNITVVSRYINIGEPSDSELSFDSEGHVVLTYDSTEDCSMSGHHRKTIITFICDHNKIVSV